METKPNGNSPMLGAQMPTVDAKQRCKCSVPSHFEVWCLQSRPRWSCNMPHVVPILLREEIRLTSWFVVYPIIYKVYVSQVVQNFFHQQYDPLGHER